MAGIKGRSGRKPKGEEKASYKDLYSLFYGKINLKKLEKKIASGKYSAREKFQHDLLTNTGRDSRQTVLKKLFPDSVIQDINLSGTFDGVILTNPRDKK